MPALTAQQIMNWFLYGQATASSCAQAGSGLPLGDGGGVKVRRCT
jgi:hypothetical protein